MRKPIKSDGLQVTTFHPGFGNSQRKTRHPLPQEARFDSAKYVKAAKQHINPAHAGPADMSDVSAASVQEKNADHDEMAGSAGSGEMSSSVIMSSGLSPLQILERLLEGGPSNGVDLPEAARPTKGRATHPDIMSSPAEQSASSHSGVSADAGSQESEAGVCKVVGNDQQGSGRCSAEDVDAPTGSYSFLALLAGT